MSHCYTPVYLEGIPWQSSVWDFGLPMQGAQVQPLVGELRSCKLCDAIKKERRRMDPENVMLGEISQIQEDKYCTILLT